MGAVGEQLDLAALGLAAGAARSLELSVPVSPLRFGGERYEIEPEQVPVALTVTRMAGTGFALELRCEAQLVGPCVRCLGSARRRIAAHAAEVDVPGGEEELRSPYLDGPLLDLSAWVRDALILALPAKILCRSDCRGLCALCAANLNEAGEGHHHDAAPDPRLAPLRELLARERS
ncbi:MAG TPA: DUF177 domain-containing protein [Solirubrobacteraceae bacterium]|nr:DUF177 domain-containing protein [Solirubrobacteraceae bacterium]